MRIVSRFAVLLAGFVFLSCGDSSSGPGTKTTLDFENGADDGFTPIALPDTLANGVVFLEIQPSGTYYDFTTADGWGFVPCDASAHSGTKMIGFEGSADVTGVITFNPPVSRVIMFAGNGDGEVITLKAFNAAGTAVDSASHTSACPMLGAADSLSVSAGNSKIITKVEIHGLYPGIDDLSFYR